MGDLGSIPGMGNNGVVILFAITSIPALGPPFHLIRRRGSFGWGVKLSTHLHLVPRLIIMSRIIPPLPQYVFMA
jgi:hypothetical protein